MAKIKTLDLAAKKLGELSGKKVRMFATTDHGRGKNADARSVVVPDGKALDLVFALREELGPGLLAYVGCARSLARPNPKGTEVVIAQGRDQFEMLRIAESNAWNYDMKTEDLIAGLKKLHAKSKLEIVQATTDTIQYRLKKLPKNLAAYCESVADFCPDIIAQGFGTLKEFEDDLARTHTVTLWWD